MKLLVDTNVLVYDTLEDSEHHGEASRLIDGAAEMYLPSIVVHGYVWVLLRRLGVDPGFALFKVEECLGDPGGDMCLCGRLCSQEGV